MSITDTKIMNAALFYLNKLITENDSSFIINALDLTNFNIQEIDGVYYVKVNYNESNRGVLQINSTFTKDRIELFINKKLDGVFNDNEIIDSSSIIDRYALYEINGKDINLAYKQIYTYNIMTKDGNKSSFSPINIEEKVDLEFTQGEPNLITNYNNIILKKKEKVLKRQ